MAPLSVANLATEKPKVQTSKAKALGNARALRERITSHPKLMVLNDEAHHVWDPDSAWNEAVSFLHDTTRKRGGGIVAQLDLSATPKDNKGNVFRHVICDTPLGEAVDAGIVKTPIIGHGEGLVVRAHGDAGYKYENHLTIGYKRWLASMEEWDKSGKKALLFVMTEDTEAADQPAQFVHARQAAEIPAEVPIGDGERGSDEVDIVGDSRAAYGSAA